jgi:sugar lactone lactonase YvrE
MKYYLAIMLLLFFNRLAYPQSNKPFHAFYWPSAVVVDSKGNLFVTGKNNKIIKITPDGNVADFAGNPNGYSGHVDGQGKDVRFEEAAGITIDAADNLYLADYNLIRKITPVGMVSTFSGNGRSEQKDGPSSVASFKHLKNIAIDNHQNLYATDENFDKANKKSYHIIRKITPKGEATTLRNRDGSVLQINYAGGITCDAEGNILVCDQGSRCIKKITSDGIISSVAGKCDLQKWNPVFKEGNVSSATLVEPAGITINRNGEIFFSDLRMHRVIKISNSKVITIAGNSEIDLSHSNIGGFAEEGYADGKAKLALFDGPQGIAFDKEGNLYIADSNNSCIRKLSPNGMITTFSK